MRNRLSLGALLLIGLMVSLTSCGNPSGLDSIQVTPVTSAIAAGGSVQLTATGKFGNAKHPSSQDVTGQVTWTSASTGIAQVG
ncbi:MAG: Ig-like domain-containing protein, partial [Acidobacteriota bacterium]|nr:Ig-like domain-containing protein [Acidobacteriota bacterium]